MIAKVSNSQPVLDMKKDKVEDSGTLKVKLKTCLHTVINTLMND